MNNIDILIVEDELIIAKNTAKKLQKMGYNVCEIISTGKSVIEYLHNHKPNLILMDIAIKGEMDGIETAAQVKLIADIPIIFMTAYADDENIERAAETGGYSYLLKPYREKELQAVIKMTLNKHQEQSVVQKSLQATVNEYSSSFNDVYLNNSTNLPNKLFLKDSFDYLISLLTTEDRDNNLEITVKKTIAAFNINLDRFYKISDCLEKEQKKIFIQEIARRLEQYVSNYNSQGITIYLKEDNFLVMAVLDEQREAKTYGQEILNILQQVFLIQDREIFLSTSIGIAFYPKDSDNIEDLLEQSIKATKYAQKQGGNRCQLFTFAFNIKDSQATKDLTMEADLHHALENGELEIYYQPKIDLRTNLVVGAEALLRWNHPKIGRISANKFITLAEESGLIKPIGEWVLEESCKQTKAWHNEGLDFLRIGINLSGFQFKQSDLFHKVTQVLFNTSLEPKYLELELTEKILIDNIKANIQKLNLLKKIGIKIVLDEFGTGYSSLGYLQQFDFDFLKIDACFIHKINNNKTNKTIVKNTISMAHELGLKVVGVGIETEAELKFLKEYKCDEIQGFLYSRPLEAKSFKNIVISLCEQTLTR